MPDPRPAPAHIVVNEFNGHWIGGHGGMELAEPTSYVRQDTYNAVVKELDKARDLLQIIVANAETIADPRMDGTTDCYAVPVDDIVAATNHVKGE